jgi:hypothetical protein
MQFPSRGGRFLLLLIGVPSGILLFILSVSVWLSLTLAPLQKLYLGAYTASSIGAQIPTNLTTVRWVMKTAPKRKPIAASPEDVVPGSELKLPASLSPEAMADGWRGLAMSAPEKTSSKILAKVLQEYIYDGASVWRLFSQPMLYCLAGLLSLYVIWRLLQQSIGLRRSGAREERHGRRTKGPELQPGRWRRHGKVDGISFRLRYEKGPLRWLPLGPTFHIPRRLESSHIELIGDTGSGKSTAIRQILRQVEERGETAIVYDPAMDFVGEFYSPERGDLILNPLDSRCPYWALGDELDREETATTIAAAFLPEKEYEKAFFTDSPRRILAHLLKRKPQPRDILRWMSDPDQLAALIKGTPLAALLDPTAPAQRAGVLSSLNLIADCLELLPEWEHTRPTFATSEWSTERKRWVFLTSSPGYRGKILPLQSVWLDLFILRMQESCNDAHAKPVWFVLDELASLNKLPQLHTAVTENRKYGNPVVLGFQGRSQLEKRYGQDAEAMLSQPATKVFFKTSEPRAAKWISEAIGEIEVERLKESRSMGMLGSKRSYSMEIAAKPLIMPSEISGLEPLHGYIKQENRVVPVLFQLAKKRFKQPEFIERKRTQAEGRPSLESLAAAAPALSLKKPEVSVQASLPLTASPVAAKPKEAFVWDESKGIE